MSAETAVRKPPISHEGPKTKLEAADLIARLDAIQNALSLELNPQDLRVYKPQRDGNGFALRLDLRLEPTRNANGTITGCKGGLFLELAKQGPMKDGNATFLWDDSRLSAKLGMADISLILTAIRRIRVTGKPLPAPMRGKKDDGSGTLISMFHKFEQGSTAIDMQFGEDGSFLKVSKSAEHRGHIKLSLTEEVQVEAYLRMSLEAFLRAGKR